MLRQNIQFDGMKAPGQTVSLLFDHVYENSFNLVMRVTKFLKLTTLSIEKKSTLFRRNEIIQLNIQEVVETCRQPPHRGSKKGSTLFPGSIQS